MHFVCLSVHTFWKTVASVHQIPQW